MANNQLTYPTMQHAQAASRIVDCFSQQHEVQAVLLTGSCARGRASRDSCLDLAILVYPDDLAAKQDHLHALWESAYQTDPIFQSLRTVGKYAHVDLEFIDGRFVPPQHGWTTGPDAFELEIGNLLVYSFPLWEKGDYLRQLKSQWLPYYGTELRRERLAMVRRYCLNNLHHIPGYCARGLYFQSFQRLWHAFGEFLQALFIARQIYPIAYDKWVREQIVEILGLPALYSTVSQLFEIHCFESDEMAWKAQIVENLLAEFVPILAAG